MSDECKEAVGWICDVIVPMLDSKDIEFEEVSVIEETFLVTAQLMREAGWNRTDMMRMLQESVFDDERDGPLH